MGKVVNRKILIAGKTFESLESAAKAYGKSRNTVDYRLSKGWSPEQAVGIVPPPEFAAKTTGVVVHVQGRTFASIKDAAKFYKRAYTHVFEVLKNGGSIEKALGLVKRTDTLESVNPKLAKQWHPTKNQPLKPSEVTSGSGIKAWWLCSKKHEWAAVINSRNRGMGCPYCAGQLATEERNFAAVYPELLKEFDFEKNINIDPKKITPRAGQKIWWKCAKGHSWQTTLANKTRVGLKGECPYCTKRMVGEDNNLAVVRPDIAKDWHPTKNKTLTPNQVVAGGSTKVWWRCKHNHEWQATVGSRVISGTGCPKCHLQTSRIEIAIYTEISALFSNVKWQAKVDGYECDILIPNKNIGIEIDGVYWHKKRPEIDKIKQSLFEKHGIQLYRLRESGLSVLSERDIIFKWSDDVFPIIAKLIKKILKFSQLDETESELLKKYLKNNTLVNEKRYREIVSQLPAPPYELSLAAKRPEIAKDWANDLNAPLLPEHFRPSASKSVWWRCSNGHIWKASLNRRESQNTGCPKCPRILPSKATKVWNFAIINPDLVSEWATEKNLGKLPEDVTPKTSRKYWWICKYGHEWQATPSDRTRGKGCPYCSGRYATKENNLKVCYPDVLKSWDYKKNKNLDPAKIAPQSGKKVWWKCENGHSTITSVSNKTKRGRSCQVCAWENSRKHDLKFFKDFAKSRGGKCLSKVYTSSKNKIIFQCKNGHEWQVRADAVIYEKRWCSKCKMDDRQLAFDLEGS